MGWSEVWSGVRVRRIRQPIAPLCLCLRLRLRLHLRLRFHLCACLCVCICFCMHVRVCECMLMFVCMIVIRECFPVSAFLLFASAFLS